YPARSHGRAGSLRSESCVYRPGVIWMMTCYLKLFAFAALLGASGAAYAAQGAPAGDRDDQFVISGWVTHAPKTPVAGRRSLFVWTKGDVFFDAPQIK